MDFNKIGAKFFRAIAATAVTAKANTKNIFLDAADSILKIVDASGNQKALEPNSGFRGEKKTFRFDFNFNGGANNGATGNITLVQLPIGDAVTKVTFLKTGTLTGGTSTVKLALATDGDVTNAVEVVDASTGINDKGIQEATITYRKASAAQNLRLVIAGEAVSGSLAILVEVHSANFFTSNRPA